MELASLAKPGALSTLTVKDLLDLTGVTACIIATAKSSAFSDSAKQAVMYEENRSILTRISWLDLLSMSAFIECPGWFGNNAGSY